MSMKKLVSFVFFTLFCLPSFAAQCKPGFVKVPALTGYTGQPYCVMQSEIVNPATGLPWTYVSFAKLQAVCATLSANSELPTNSLWQGIARKAASLHANWDSGIVGVGALKTDITVPDGEGGDSTLYDFGDGHWEWVRGQGIQISSGFIYQILSGGPAYTINGLSLSKADHFGDPARCSSTSQCGVTTNQATGGIARGGDDDEPGFFGVAENHDPLYAPGYSDFSGRCAYPASDDN
jgi:hypothetical protein